jgi:hypothetical protein
MRWSAATTKSFLGTNERWAVVAVTYALPSDVSVRLGSALGASFDAAQAAAFLDDVERMIRVRFPNLDAQVVAGLVSAADVVAVEANAVRRVMLNAEGFTDESIDNWSGKRSAALADGLLYITPEEWATLSPLLEGRRRGSIRMVAYGETYYGQPYYPPVYP